ARRHTRGAARSTLARRTAAARTFTAYAHRHGWLPSDPGQQVATPKLRRSLPAVLRQRDAAGLMDAAAGDSPTGLRDRLVLEMLYATRIRVSELVRLHIDDVGRERRRGPALGEGKKQADVPDRETPEP